MESVKYIGLDVHQSAINSSSAYAPFGEQYRNSGRQLSDPRTTVLMDTTPPWLAIPILQQPARSRSVATSPIVQNSD
jgi:hypothetical protein